jgi:hypothetical protein
MILLKVKIKRDEKKGSTHLSYPTPYWDSKKVMFGPIYEDVQRGQGRTWSFCVIGVSELDAPNFLRGHNKKDGDHRYEVIEISKEEAISICDPWVPVVEVPTDRDAIMAALARKARGKGTREDDDILNPDHPAIGYNKTKSFKERLEQAMNAQN